MYPLDEGAVSVALNRSLGQLELTIAERHHDIVSLFGRFPPRNTVLGRTTTEEEQGS